MKEAYINDWETLHLYKSVAERSGLELVALLNGDLTKEEADYALDVFWELHHEKETLKLSKE